MKEELLVLQHLDDHARQLAGLVAEERDKCMELVKALAYIKTMAEGLLKDLSAHNVIAAQIKSIHLRASEALEK